MYDQARRRLPPLQHGRRWLVPHFEKMLYDNALLARVYVDAWQATGDRVLPPHRARDAGLRPARDDDAGGGFYSSQDADSEGEEGASSSGRRPSCARSSATTPRSSRRFFGVTDGGNFEGRNILNVPMSQERFVESHGLDAANFDDLLERASTSYT